MLYGYIIFVGLPKKCTIPFISFLNKNSIHFGSSYMQVWTRIFCNRKGWCVASRFGRSGSSGFVGGLLLLGMGASESWMSEDLGVHKTLMYALGGG